MRPLACVLEDTILENVSGAITVCPLMDDWNATVDVPCEKRPDNRVKFPFIVTKEPFAVRLPPFINVSLVMVSA